MGAPRGIACRRPSYFVDGGRLMSVKVLLPTALRSLIGDRSEVQMSGGSVGDVMWELVRNFPELKRHLYTETGMLRNFVNIYVNDENVRFMQEEKTPVNPGDTISIVPSIAGGNSVDLKMTADEIELTNE